MNANKLLIATVLAIAIGAPIVAFVGDINMAQLSRIAQLDQRTAFADQCLHSAEADVPPPRRRSGFDPLQTSRPNRGHSKNVIRPAECSTGAHRFSA